MHAKQASLSCLHSPVSACLGVLYTHYHFSYSSESVPIIRVKVSPFFAYLGCIVSLGECILISLGKNCCPEASHSTVEVSNSLEGSLGHELSSGKEAWGQLERRGPQASLVWKEACLLAVL